MIPSHGWYNANSLRDYPFQSRPGPISAEWDLPRSLVLDAGVVLSPSVLWNPSEHRVYLHSVTRNGNAITFDLRTNAIGGQNYRVVFSQTDADSDTIVWQNSQAIDPVEDDPYICQDGPVWKAFLVYGQLSDLFQWMDNGTRVFPDDLWVIEPTRIQAVRYLRGIHLANFPRVQTTAPAGCEENPPPPAGEGDVIPNALCLSGDIILRPGFNCDLRQETYNNAIVIGAAVGAGQGQPCDEIPLHEDEAPPPGSDLLTGGPRCKQILKSINGLGGRHLQIVAGHGVSIRPDDTDPHKLIIDLNLRGLALCDTNDPPP